MYCSYSTVWRSVLKRGFQQCRIAGTSRVGTLGSYPTLLEALVTPWDSVELWSMGTLSLVLRRKVASSGPKFKGPFRLGFFLIFLRLFTTQTLKYASVFTILRWLERSGSVGFRVSPEWLNQDSRRCDLMFSLYFDLYYTHRAYIDLLTFNNYFLYMNEFDLQWMFYASI